MDPLIRISAEKMLTGMRTRMNLTHNNTALLWKNFMSRRNEIRNAKSTELISMQLYPPAYFQSFNPENEFEKWAVVQVTEFQSTPAGMENFLLPAGVYAVFHYKGLSTDDSIFRYIFTEWFPSSGYDLDQRPHFEILGEKYKNNDPASEEEIWIPVKKGH
jgi:AraC family transcriptional regulator